MLFPFSGLHSATVSFLNTGLYTVETDGLRYYRHPVCNGKSLSPAQARPQYATHFCLFILLFYPFRKDNIIAFVSSGFSYTGMCPQFFMV